MRPKMYEVVVAVVLIAILSAMLGYIEGHRDGMAKVQTEVAEYVLMTPLPPEKVQFNQVEAATLTMFREKSGEIYGCGQIKHWGSARIGFEEPRNAVEVVTSAPFRDLNGSLVGVFQYGK